MTRTAMLLAIVVGAAPASLATAQDLPPAEGPGRDPRPA